jgi:aspartyl-tRNA(Asn)/glutamyl-tRNA(Gln) amidotransferase subunit B
VEERKINRNMAREIFDISLTTGEDPLELVEKMDTGKITNSDEIASLIKQIIADHPHLINQSKNNSNVNNFILGLIMKNTKGKADPPLTMKLIIEILSTYE